MRSKSEGKHGDLKVIFQAAQPVFLKRFASFLKIIRIFHMIRMSSCPTTCVYFAGEGVQADDPRFMSGAFFQDQRQSVFLPHVSTQESPIENVFATTRIVEKAGTWQLRFSVHWLPVPLSFPLEPRDVPRAEEWLENHEIFHFENE